VFYHNAAACVALLRYISPFKGYTSHIHTPLLSNLQGYKIFFLQSLDDGHWQPPEDVDITDLDLHCLECDPCLKDGIATNAAQLVDYNYLHTQVSWLSYWVTHITSAAGSPIQVPNIACGFIIPLVPTTWSYLLSNHPSQEFLYKRFHRVLDRFWLYNDPFSFCKEKHKPYQRTPPCHAEVLEKEMIEAGSFRKELVLHVHVNQFDMIPSLGNGG